MAVINFDQLTQSAFSCPPGRKTVELCDSEMPGLIADVSAGRPGYARFRFKYKDPTGKTTRYALGDSNSHTGPDLRNEVIRLKAMVKEGRDPRIEQTENSGRLTLQYFFTQHYLPAAKLRKRSWQDDERLFNRDIKPQFGNQLMSSIRRADIQKRHLDVRESGKAASTANHLLRLIKRLFNVAIELELVTKNPAANIKLFPEDGQRDICLSDEETSKLLHTLRTHPNRLVCNLALLLLATGARKNEALKARWIDIDRDARVWRIPAPNSKSKKIRAIPLNAAALQVLDALGTEDDHEHLFMNSKTDEPLQYVGKSWGRIRERAGLPWLRLHDLRHLFAGNAVRGGTSLYVVQKLLGHADPRVTQRYAHLSVQDTLAASESASLHLAEALAESADA